MSEIELKLGFPRTSLRALEAHPLLVGARRGASRRRLLVSTYHDTPDEALRRAGAALRVRRDGRRWVQTFKTAGTAIGGLHTREEAEWIVPTDALVGAHVEPLLAALDPPVDVGRLRPAFVTRFRRTAFDVDLGAGTVAEVAIDVGAVEGRGRSVELCEIEIELRTGDPARLFDLAIGLAADVPFTVRMPSKAERGYALGRRADRRPVRPTAPPIGRDADPAGAAAGLLAACLAGMQANDSGMKDGDDPEYLHRFRIAARRLRTVLAAVPTFAPAVGPSAIDVLKADLRWLFDEIGPARDADVWCDELLPRITASADASPGLDLLVRASRRLRREDRARARAAMADARYVVLQLRVGRLVVLLAQAGKRRGRDGEPGVTAGDDSPQPEARTFRECAATLLGRRWSVVRKRDPLAGSVEARHATRVATKKLRYLADLAGPAFGRPRRRRRFERRLADVQDVLGRINDAATGTRILDRLAASSTKSKPPGPAVLAGTRAWLAGYGAGVLALLPRVWARLCDAKRFW